jgi:hypothetical protein
MGSSRPSGFTAPCRKAGKNAGLLRRRSRVRVLSLPYFARQIPAIEHVVLSAQASATAGLQLIPRTSRTEIAASSRPKPVIPAICSGGLIAGGRLAASTQKRPVCRMFLPTGQRPSLSSRADPARGSRTVAGRARISNDFDPHLLSHYRVASPMRSRTRRGGATRPRGLPHYDPAAPGRVSGRSPSAARLHGRRWSRCGARPRP